MNLYLHLTLFDMGFFELSVRGGGGGNHNFGVTALMIMKIGKDIKIDVFYAMVYWGAKFFRINHVIPK